MDAADHMPEEAPGAARLPWNAVGLAVTRRREALGLSREQAVALTNGAVRHREWTSIESGQGLGVRSQVRRDIALALGWAPDAINQIASGIRTRVSTRSRARVGRPPTGADAFGIAEDAQVDFHRLRELDPEGYKIIVAHARRLLAAALERERNKKT